MLSHTTCRCNRKPPGVAHASDLDSRYLKLRTLGEGTYGVVYEAVEVDTGRKIAMKRLRVDDRDDALERVGIPTAAIREVSLLRELRHPHVIELTGVSHIGTQLWLSFELCDMDLRQFLKRRAAEVQKIDRKDKLKTFLPIQQCKTLCRQLLSGIAYCHSQRIIHRDLKPQNLLLEKSGTNLKISDFGLARNFITPTQKYTHEVVTLWYRAPELLLGDLHYTSALDIWSCGCIIAELLTGRPLFHGDSEVDTLFQIFRMLGTPVDVKQHNEGKEAVWPGVSSLQYYQDLFPRWPADPTQCLKRALGIADPLLLEFLRRMLEYDPSRRLSAAEALAHPWLSCEENEDTWQQGWR